MRKIVMVIAAAAAELAPLAGVHAQIGLILSASAWK
jgi:hypothetical protein